MEKEVDIFADARYPYRRWDRDKHASLLNIVFHGGTFGNFLKFFLDKFSTLSPDITGDPYTKIGTSHNKAIVDDHYSGQIQRYHNTFINDNKGETNLPICMPLPTTEKHYLYLKAAQWFRAGEKMVAPDDLWTKSLGEMPDWLFKDHAKKILELYGITTTSSSYKIPKFIVRDWYKLDFLKGYQQSYTYKWFEAFRKHPFFVKQKMFHLDLETFFHWEVFIKNIRDLDQFFTLSLDFDRESEMKKIFDKGFSLDNIRHECNLAVDVCEGQKNSTLDHLDVCIEAFIYAKMEKKYPDIQMPLTNRFFSNFEEIRQFLENFPNWYRRPNPNIG